ncbi:N-formylglutamate amidohydrolase [Gluconobacter wancherniae]|uniref:N-formylglutamate amidohydrolase n=1 Tax=Gluconobacter wancherniae TaxID=1307955 RepID=UPI001B8D1E8D|nr:N-formylglutamate amidohydrolase [Gluconobacter wancherniae]MBS1088300.1 N-formylglutamate amidohydrolase [Gluconobacter wancherniae]
MSFQSSNPPYLLSFPEKTAVPLIVSSPHSGQDYPTDFLQAARLSIHDLQKAEDRFVDKLFDAAPEIGATFLRAAFPRVWCDVNRDRRELDARMFKPPLPSTALLRTPKVRAGFGVIPRCASQGRAIYSHCLAPEEVERRISSCWLPYHQALSELISDVKTKFGYALLVDVHSMPRLEQYRECNVVFGDAHGHSCSSKIIGFLEENFQSRGYSTQRNVPYAGGYITRNYGRPLQGVHAIQIELCRSLYMNTATLEPSRMFIKVREDLKQIMGDLAFAFSEKI